MHNKKGDGCQSLYLVKTPAIHGDGHNKASHRCCQKRAGIFLKQWRCVGKDSPKCPGYELKGKKNG